MLRTNPDPNYKHRILMISEIGLVVNLKNVTTDPKRSLPDLNPEKLPGQLHQETAD